jgi:hypothetical protein
MGTTKILSRREEAARKFAYNLVFEPFKTITIDCPRVFRIKQQFLEITLILVRIFRIFSSFFNIDFFYL